MAPPSHVLYICKDRDPAASLNTLFQSNDCHDEELFNNIYSEFPLVQIVSFYL